MEDQVTGAKREDNHTGKDEDSKRKEKSALPGDAGRKKVGRMK